jgi:hypothetical protein
MFEMTALFENRKSCHVHAAAAALASSTLFREFSALALFTGKTFSTSSNFLHAQRAADFV